MVAYNILPELGLIIDYYSGSLNANDIINLKIKQINDMDYNPNYNIIACMSELIIEEVSRQSTKQFVKLISDKVNFKGKRNTAIITKSPKQVVASTLYQIESKERTMHIKTVSTVEAALNWVSIPPEYEPLISKNIELLKKQADD
jgi:hypothetical protein